MGYSFWLAARVLLYAPSHRQDSTYHVLCYTSHGALAGTRHSSMGPPHEGSIWRPIVPWANTLTMELHLTPHQTYGYVKMDNNGENPLLPLHVLLISVSSKVIFYMHHLTDRTSHITVYDTPVMEHWLELEIGHWVQSLQWVKSIKEPLLSIGKSSLCGSSGLPFSLSEWSLTICLTPYNRK